MREKWRDFDRDEAWMGLFSDPVLGLFAKRFSGGGEILTGRIARARERYRVF